MSAPLFILLLLSTVEKTNASAYTIRCNGLIDLADQSLQHFSGSNFRKFCSPVSNHSLNTLGPLYGSGQLIYQVLPYLVWFHDGFCNYILVNRAHSPVKTCLLNGCCQFFLCRSH